MTAFDFLSPKDADWRAAVDQFKWYRVERFILHAHRWKDYQASGPKLKWKRVRFDKKGVKRLPDDKGGLYSFIAEPRIAGHTAVRYLLYVGQAQGQSLRKRVTSYLYESQKEKPRVHVSEMLEKFTDHLWLYFAEVNDASTITNIENQLLAAFLPPSTKLSRRQSRTLGMRPSHEQNYSIR
jgi:hypothetical protein